MKAKYIKRVKSRDEILATMTNVDYVGHKTYGVMKQNNSIGPVDISDWLWTLCGKEIQVYETPTDSHDFDYSHFDFPKEGEDREEIKVVYFMEQWLEDISSGNVASDDCCDKLYNVAS